MKPINEARESLGLRPLAHTFDQHARADRILVLSSEGFGFPGPPLPPNVMYAGPQLDDPPWAEAWNSPWDADDSRPLVLIAFSSTFQNREDVLERVAQAFRKLPARGLMTIGPALIGRSFPVPGNVVVVPSAPHAAVLPQARAVVTHCGHGTTLKALSHGVPILCLPMGRDQGDNAARVVWHGAGLRLKADAGASVIEAALNSLITDRRYGDAARALASRMTAENRSDRAVAELERLAAGRGRA